MCQSQFRQQRGTCASLNPGNRGVCVSVSIQNPCRCWTELGLGGGVGLSVAVLKSMRVAVLGLRAGVRHQLHLVGYVRGDVGC